MVQDFVSKKKKGKGGKDEMTQSSEFDEGWRLEVRGLPMPNLRIEDRVLLFQVTRLTINIQTRRHFLPPLSLLSPSTVTIN